MLEFCINVGDANAQDTALVLLSLSSVLQGVFFIITILMIKKENAQSRKEKHSQKPPWKRR